MSAEDLRFLAARYLALLVVLAGFFVLVKSYNDHVVARETAGARAELRGVRLALEKRP